MTPEQRKILDELADKIQGLENLADKHIHPHTMGYPVKYLVSVRAGGNMVHREIPAGFLKEVRAVIEDLINITP